MHCTSIKMEGSCNLALVEFVWMMGGGRGGGG